MELKAHLDLAKKNEELLPNQSGVSFKEKRCLSLVLISNAKKVYFFKTFKTLMT